MPRLIDAEKLKADLIGNRYGTQAIAYVIDQQPTVDAESVKHGHWVDEGKKFLPIYCSRCGFGKIHEDQRNYAYCPNCGAKMTDAIDTPTDPVAK